MTYQLPGTASSAPSSPSAVSHWQPLRGVLLALTLLLLSTGAAAQQDSEETDESPRSDRQAEVVIDGNHLFPVRGISAFPARERAQQIRGKIIALAKDESFDTAALTVSPQEDRTVISANGVALFSLFDEDAALEGLNRAVLAEAYVARIAAAITEYRYDRSSPVLLQRAGIAALVTLVSAVLWWLLLKVFQRLNRWAQNRVQRSIDELASKSHNIISSRQVWGLFASLLKVLRLIAFGVLLYFFLNTVLGLFPWTRPLAIVLFNLVLDPLESMGKGFVAQIPNLSFLVVLVFVVRYILRIIRVFFNGVARGRIKLQNFDEDWAMPTFKIVRVLVIAFALVIAYPYIPGSNSLAFKGVSVFMGVILSMGASSFISSMIAGMLMTYRGAFKEKDVIKLGETVGTVMDIKLMTTRLRTPKNEMVVIPNSNILNADVVNYSTMARENSLILHTIVGIGYDTPWRQVEAMLKEAALRTPDILEDPEPFVLQPLLGDYAVNYELNAFTAKDTGIPATYSALHANIQDVFNEHGVQIMSPAYVADPAADKIVPPEKWYLPPAAEPAKKN